VSSRKDIVGGDDGREVGERRGRGRRVDAHAAS
jgi:hypothetical protein